MFHSKIKLILISVLSYIFISLVILFGLFVYYQPAAPISLVVFKTSYSLFPFKKAFLEFYSPADRNYGVNTRTDIDDSKFLLQRIETTNDESEISAIAHYFTLQAKARNYDIFINISDAKKSLVVEQLIKELDDNSSRLSDKIMLLETTRTGKRIGKGSIGVEGSIMPNFNFGTKLEEVEEWRNETIVATGAAQKYKQWWNSNLSWEEKKKINPLEGTGIKVSQCCG